ncbi:glycosyl hydrolase family 38 protein [Ostertagia ostertagi]
MAGGPSENISEATSILPVCNRWSNKEGIINVHLVPHTHDDLGWIKTVDEYYYGGLMSESRAFNFINVADQIRCPATMLLLDQHIPGYCSGQVEIVGGGWVQNDEAATHYVDIVDQMSFGLKKLEQLFGQCGKPETAWQIDPFGHSKEQANLFAMDPLLCGRFFERVAQWSTGIHGLHLSVLRPTTLFRKRSSIGKNKSLEFIWNTSDDLKTQILGGSFFQDDYGPPKGFCFDALCGDDPIMDNPDLEGYNLDEKISAFVTHSSFLRSSHVMLLMGSDFQYTDANTWYTNLDKLIQHVNGNATHGLHVFYSTPSCYVKGLTESSTTRLPTKDDDFFP